MSLLFNELSFHNQLTHDQFPTAIETLMKLRQKAKNHGVELMCNRLAKSVKIGASLPLEQAVNKWLSRDQRNAFLQWITKVGPYWDDYNATHTSNDFLTFQGEVVTETSLAESAMQCFHNQASALVSITPSTWNYSPLPVLYFADDNVQEEINVENVWEVSQLEKVVPKLVPDPKSWTEVEQQVRSKFLYVSFTDGCFKHLAKRPFQIRVAKRIEMLIGVLDEINSCWAPDGSRTADGNELYMKHFTGENALFSDSSDSEKSTFKDQLTFEIPGKEGSKVMCGWHGKERSVPLRLHFTWPISAAEDLFVVYVGEKITKR